MKRSSAAMVSRARSRMGSGFGGAGTTGLGAGTGTGTGGMGGGSADPCLAGTTIDDFENQAKWSDWKINKDSSGGKLAPAVEAWNVDKAGEPWVFFVGADGKVRERLSEPVPIGTQLLLGGREVGRVGSSVLSPRLGPIALAIVRREASPGDTLAAGDGATAEVVALPFP